MWDPWLLSASASWETVSIALRVARNRLYYPETVALTAIYNNFESQHCIQLFPCSFRKLKRWDRRWETHKDKTLPGSAQSAGSKASLYGPIHSSIICLSLPAHPLTWSNFSFNECLNSNIIAELSKTLHTNIWFMPFVQGGILFSLTGKKPSQNLNGYQQSLHYPILNICPMPASITGSFGASVKQSSAGDGAYRQPILSLTGMGWGIQRAPYTNWKLGYVFSFNAPVCFSPTREKISLSYLSFFFFLFCICYFTPLPQPALIISYKKLSSLKARSTEAFLRLWIFPHPVETRGWQQNIGPAHHRAEVYNSCCSKTRRKSTGITLMDSLSNCSLR